MRNKVFDTFRVDATKEPMFFGNPVNVSRYDKQKYAFFEKQTRNMMKFFWVPEEVSLDKDPANFHKELSPSAQHIFTSNLYYQILLDSVQGRAPSLAILPFTSLPELETLVTVWSSFESLHSRSYTHIIRGIYHNPDEMLDGILDISHIIDRAKAVTRYYDDFIEYGNYYNLLGYGKHVINGVTIDINERDLHKKMYLMLIAMNILEGVRFYVSFACTWAFAESLKVMEKCAKIIKFICRDENLHLAVTSFIIKKMMDGSEGELLKRVAAECTDEVYAMYHDAVEQEKDWADYLFKSGSIVGLNAEILKSYVEFIANKRMRTIGLRAPYNQPTNPLPWTEFWISSKDTQEAPQETEITQYIIGGINNDVNVDTFKGFEL